MTEWVRPCSSGLIGIIIASLVNYLLASSMLQFVVSFGVLVFAASTAYDNPAAEERLHLRLCLAGRGRGGAWRPYGALSLYLNFINLFTLLLQCWPRD